MSKRRSIAKKINLQLDFPLPDTYTPLFNSADRFIQDTYFGEDLKSKRKPVDDDTFSIESPVIFENIIEDEDIFSVDWSKSSGSSTSGSDNLETEATQKLTEEYKNIERILYREKATKSCNDIELKQWKDNFPHLRISGKAIDIPTTSTCSSDEYFEEIFAEHSDLDHTNDNTIPSKDVRKYIIDAVINNILKEAQKKRSKNSADPIFRRELEITQDYPLSIRTSLNRETKYTPSSGNETFQQVSSIPLQNSPMLYPKFEYQSPLMQSHLSAAKWQRENLFTDFSSLPQIASSNVPGSSNNSGNDILSANKNRYSANLRHTSGTSGVKPYSKYTPSSPRIKNIVLPPIQNLNLSVDGDKSVSSTPRKYGRPVSHKLAQLTENKLYYNNLKFPDK